MYTLAYFVVKWLLVSIFRAIRSSPTTREALAILLIFIIEKSWVIALVRLVIHFISINWWCHWKWPYSYYWHKTIIIYDHRALGFLCLFVGRRSRDRWRPLDVCHRRRWTSYPCRCSLIDHRGRRAFFRLWNGGSSRILFLVGRRFCFAIGFR